MIIWLASYPKSGNTWLRAFITSLLSENIGKNSLENINKIRAYPITDDFKNLLNDFKDFKKIEKKLGNNSINYKFTKKNKVF